MAKKHLLYFQIFRKAYFARVPLLKIFLTEFLKSLNQKASIHESLLKYNFLIYERDELFKITRDFLKSTKRLTIKINLKMIL